MSKIPELRKQQSKIIREVAKTGGTRDDFERLGRIARQIEWNLLPERIKRMRREMACRPR
jgi:hypothetical protein